MDPACGSRKCGRQSDECSTYFYEKKINNRLNIHIYLTKWNLFSSPEHEVLMVSYCGQSMSVVRRASSVVRRAASTIALKAYSSYTPGPIDLMVGSIRVTCRSEIAKIVPIGNPRWPTWPPSLNSIYSLLLLN